MQLAKKIFRALFYLSLLLTISALGVFFHFVHDYSTQQEQAQLTQELGVFTQSLDLAGDNLSDKFLSQLHCPACRLTIIASDGQVLADTTAKATALGNHKQRPEFQAALKTGSGHSVRYSNTLLRKYVYVAQKLKNGAVVRISAEYDSPLAFFLKLAFPFITLLLVSIIITFFASRLLAKHIVKPFNSINLEDGIDNNIYDELSPFFQKLQQQQRQIKRQKKQLTQQKSEFAVITGSMSEGLLLLDAQGDILHINPAAQRFFCCSSQVVGKYIATIHSWSQLQLGVKKAIKGTGSEVRICREERLYLCKLTPVIRNDKVKGVVILLLDYTEKDQAEKMRREFSANVSHELKTPLHAISGYAELIASGMAQSTDVVPFAQKIHAESQRLTALINDILSLSKLDEAQNYELEAVDLADVLRCVQDSLVSYAKEQDITLQLKSSSLMCLGVPSLLFTLFYNLTENAIKYNQAGGYVTISAADENGQALVEVTDNGPGIPLPDQARIFERFYRVDKSHNSAKPGTGLGLSIVKNIVQIHFGKVEVNSELGKGTTMRVFLSLANNESGSSLTPNVSPLSGVDPNLAVDANADGDENLKS